MAKKREYRSSIRSRQMIQEAFVKLLDEKSFEKITITDIVNRADLNRSTFYAHYNDIYSVVEDIENDSINRHMEWMKQTAYRKFFEDPMPYGNIICSMLEENIQLYTKIGKVPNLKTILEKCQQTMIEDIMNQEDISESIRTSTFFKIRVHFLVGAIMDTYRQCAEGKLANSLPEVSQELAILIKKANIDFVEYQGEKNRPQKCGLFIYSL